jgi:hypothetical protein
LIKDAQLILLRHDAPATRSRAARPPRTSPGHSGGVRQTVNATRLLPRIGPKIDACYCSPAVGCVQSAVLACQELKGVKPKPHALLSGRRLTPPYRSGVDLAGSSHNQRRRAITLRAGGDLELVCLRAAVEQREEVFLGFGCCRAQDGGRNQADLGWPRDEEKHFEVDGQTPRSGFGVGRDRSGDLDPETAIDTMKRAWQRSAGGRFVMPFEVLRQESRETRETASAADGSEVRSGEGCGWQHVDHRAESLASAFLVEDGRLNVDEPAGGTHAMRAARECEVAGFERTLVFPRPRGHSRHVSGAKVHRMRKCHGLRLGDRGGLLALAAAAPSDQRLGNREGESEKDGSAHRPDHVRIGRQLLPGKLAR